MSYESEDRYWTDYLRVALPVIGLLLMLALFWWWAQQFIGDDGDPDDIAQATQTIIATAPALTPTNTVPVVIDATESTDETSTPGGDNNGDGDETPSDNGQPENCGFENGDQVVVTSDGVRLRSEPNADSEDTIIADLDEGVTLRIIEDCFVEGDDGLQWWRVRNEETSRSGYVAGEYLAPADDEE